MPAISTDSNACCAPLFRRLAWLLCLAVLTADPAGAGEPSRVPQSAAAAARDKSVVRIGAVAYSPAVVTVFSDLRRYLGRHDFASDFVLYSNYDALVAALAQGEIEIAWNTPLAHAQYHLRANGRSRTLVMRDVDCDVRSVLVARAEAPLQTLQDLPGKKLVLGSADAAEATVLPLYYLRQEHVDLDELTILSLDREVDFKGNPCCSPSHVVQALLDGRGDAGIITEALWQQIEKERPGQARLKRVWTSPAFSHCVFTAAEDFDDARARRFTDLMTAMRPSEPGCQDIMRLEGTKKWLSGSADGFADLITALQSK